jgi:hypothetical protein
MYILHQYRYLLCYYFPYDAKKIDLSVDEIIKIERNTVGQQENDDWKKFRKQRLTASNFGKVCKLRPTTSQANTIKYILYDIFQGSSLY